MKHIDDAKRTDIQTKAGVARGAILSMTTLAGSGHPGGSMSAIDLLLTLYSYINHDPKNPDLETRDRVIVSNGHISPGVYSTLGLMGYFKLEDAISQFRKLGSIFEGHIERDVPGVEWTTGNLGQGLSAAAGMALASKLKGVPYRCYVLMGDGEQQKGQLSEARRFAVKYKLGNLVAIVDYNRLQISGNISDVMPQNIRHNYESDGWKVLEVNGHDIAQVYESFASTGSGDTPTMILAHTVMGKGVSFMENKEKFHGSTLNEEQLEAALKELKQPNRLGEYKALRKAFNPKDVNHADDRFVLKTDLSGGIPKLYESDTDNRSAWGTAIASLAEANKKNNTPIVVLDCDLQGSVKTADFEQVSPDRFIQAGIMEQNAAVVSGALSACGIQTFWADFGVFGISEVYNSQRLNDINKTNVKVVVTHVGTDVGADGKTHQCIDYISLCRTLFGFRLICPADPNQTDRVIRWLANKPGNYLVTMGRSKVPIIRNEDLKPYYGVEYNYDYGQEDVLREGKDGTIFVTGTPVANAVKAVEALRQEGIYPRLVYVSSPLEISDDAIETAVKNGFVVSIEDHSINGGLGTTIAERMVDLGAVCKLVKLGASEYPISGESAELYKMLGIDSASIIKVIKANLRNGK